MADNIQDQLGWALVLVRALEKRNFERANQAAQCFHKLGMCGKSANAQFSALSEKALGACRLSVGDLVMDLAKKDINRDLQNLRHLPPEAGDCERSLFKDSILKKLKRLSPGEAATITCVVDDEGEHHVSPQEMAKALCKHWQEVFGPSSCNVPGLHSWLSRLFPVAPNGGWITGMLARDNPDWTVLKTHIKRAISIAKNTMPGPDGIPALAFKCLGDLATDTLFDVFTVLSSSDAEATLLAAFSQVSAEEAHGFNNSLLCLLPKSPTGSDEQHGTYFHPSDTRPLSISNVDNRLLASAARLAWEPILEAWVSDFQRGFLKGRSMLHNVIDIDWHAMTVSLTHPRGALLLFDFKAAFPSVSHPFLLHCLHALGLPESAMAFIKTMYSQNRCCIRLQGQDFPGFRLQGGVRQGCPLSPLLFAVCVDILLRTIIHEVPSCICRAFADDIAAVVTDWDSHGPILETIFREFRMISNLGLNIKKTVCMPLWPTGIRDLVETLGRQIPGWAQIQIDSRGKYLGFMIGPGKATSSWDKPLKKYKERVARWSQIGGGMQYATLAYNIFALSTLLYVAQLEAVPRFVLIEERVQILRMFPGPGQWMIPEDAWYLKENYGLAKSAQPLALVARAAKLRVSALGCHFGCRQVTGRQLRRLGTDNIYARKRALAGAMASTEYIDRILHWSSWYKHNFCRVLVDNADFLKSKGITTASICMTIAGNEAPWDKDEVGKIFGEFQKTALRAIKKTEIPNAIERIRSKVDRWRNVAYGLSGLPGHYSPLIARHLVSLGKIATPRVHAAVFTTLWNGWCTHRRFQQRHKASNVCLFMCRGTAEDSLEHYCRCPVVRRVAEHTFRFSYPAEEALTLWLLNSRWLDSPDNLLSLGLLVYGVYMAYNTIRYHKIGSSDDAFQCIVQHCKQGAFGHPASMSHLDTRWQSPISYIC